MVDRMRLQYWLWGTVAPRLEQSLSNVCSVPARLRRSRARAYGVLNFPGFNWRHSFDSRPASLRALKMKPIGLATAPP